MLRHGEGRKYSLYEKEVGVPLSLQLQVPCGGVMGKEAGWQGRVQVRSCAASYSLDFTLERVGND